MSVKNKQGAQTFRIAILTAMNGKGLDENVTLWQSPKESEEANQTLFYQILQRTR